MKITAYLAALTIIVVVVIPYAITNAFSQPPEINQKNAVEEDVTEQSVPEGMKISVYLEDKQQNMELPLEEYVTCVVACEMPAAFEPEALKAQSVAARTYAIAKQGNLCNTVHCQVFEPEPDIKAEKGEEWVDTYWEKICSAVRETEGQVIFYDGELAQQAMFYSSSGGKTENSEDIFATAVPYLKSVDSEYEQDATHRNDEFVFTIKQFMDTLNAVDGIKGVDETDVRKMKIKSRTSGGSVTLISIGENELSGVEMRTIFGLSSMNFTFKIDDENVKITTIGFGHGVGMSQYGANGMAKQGYNYVDILKHYYSGVEIKNINEQ